MNKQISIEQDVNSGVAQGSLFGPLFSVIDVNDIPEFMDALCKQVADDPKLYTNQRLEINLSLKTLATWCKESDVCVSALKYDYLVFKGKDNVNFQFSVQVCFEEKRILMSLSVTIWVGQDMSRWD